MVTLLLTKELKLVELRETRQDFLAVSRICEKSASRGVEGRVGGTCALLTSESSQHL